MDEVDGYRCDCPTEYTGPRCADVDHCVGNPCDNGGTCVGGSGSFTCNCTENYEGSTCQLSRKNILSSFLDFFFHHIAHLLVATYRVYGWYFGHVFLKIFAHIHLGKLKSEAYFEVYYFDSFIISCPWLPLVDPCNHSIIEWGQ